VNQIKDKLNWESVFQASMLAKALDAGEVNKVITFQNLVDRAIAFAELVKVLSPKSTSINTIHGYQGAKIRDEIKHQFGLTEKGVLTNVRCLSEGVDLPEVDAVMFCDERTSVIDLVQAVGRALRKPEGEDKIATILLPVPIPEDAETLDDIPWDESNGMATFHWIIQAMRDQDEELHEEVNGICIDQAKGRGNRPRGKRGGRGKENRLRSHIGPLQTQLDWTHLIFGTEFTLESQESTRHHWARSQFLLNLKPGKGSQNILHPCKC
jgi:predicted helicase